MIINSDFTGGATQEAGLFEELMRTVASHTKAQYDAQRIKQTDFGAVYLGAMQNAMQVASQFVLTKGTSNQQELLLEQQVIGQEKQNLLLDAQIAKMEADTNLSVKQLELLDEQLALTIQQTAKVTQDIAQVATQVAIGTKQLDVMDSTITQTNAQAGLVTQQEANTLAQYANIAKTGLKLDAEQSILAQKAITETAQTTGTITDGSSSIGGLVGAQAELYAKQKDGYDRDAEQKTAKIFADFYSINRSTDTDIFPSAYGANGVNCMDIFDILRTGVGAPLTDRTQET